MTEEVNVLVFGHPKSGKSSIISKVLELGGLLSEEQIQSYKGKIKDDNQIEEKSDWYLNYVKTAKKPKPTFARTFYQKEGKKFMLLEFQSDESYFQKLMTKIKSARIGVLVLSGVYRQNYSKLESIQTRKYIQLFRAICGSEESVFHASSKLIVLINKNDAKFFFFDALRSKLAKLLKDNGFDTSKVEIISFSSRSDKDMQLFLSHLRALAASKDYCLRSEYCMETPDSMDSIFKNMWDKLIITDVHLDADSRNNKMWHERAETLYLAGTKLLQERESLEASNIIKVACKAAEKAIISNVDDLLLSLILSHGHYENGNYQVAINHYEKAKELASKDKNLEGNIQSYLLLLGEIHMEKAKELVKQSQQVVKSRRKDQKKLEQSKAKELEEAKTNVVQDKPEDHEIVEKIDKISAKSSSTYLIDPEKRDTLYSGCRMIPSSKKAFIPIELSKLQDYEHIETLGFQHPNMLAVNDITKSVIGSTPLILLVAEDVDTIDWYFTGMFQKFLKDHELSVELIRSKSSEEKDAFMRSWWNLIAKDFQVIFGDVVNGLLYLYSLGMPSGGLRDHIYVSGDKRGRILPRMDKMKTYEDDIVDLVKIMMDVIYQPRLQLGIKKETDFLPPELEHFLSFVKKDKLSHVSATWLLDQPYFWSSPKRVNFMRKLRKCIQKLSIDFNAVDLAVDRLMIQEFGKKIYWFDHLKDPMLIEIFNAGGKGTVKEYSQNGDIVRFFNAVCSHANEQKWCDPKPIDDGMHEKIFRSHFPRIYTCLVNLIFNCAYWKTFRNFPASEALEWFLSSSDV